MHIVQKKYRLMLFSVNKQNTVTSLIQLCSLQNHEMHLSYSVFMLPKCSISFHTSILQIVNCSSQFCTNAAYIACRIVYGTTPILDYMTLELWEGGAGQTTTGVGAQGKEQTRDDVPLTLTQFCAIGVDSLLSHCIFICFIQCTLLFQKRN